MKVEFTKDCEVGIKTIDDQHRKFFQYINSALEATEGNDDEAIMTARNLYKKLKDYADFHFQDEETYMREINDSEMVRQIHEHLNFKKKLAELEGEGELTREHLKELIMFLYKWLYSHILTSDTLIGKEHHGGRYTLTKEFVTGIKLVDEQHAMLFEIIGRAWDVLEDDLIFDKFDKIVSILNELKVYTQHHFADEEEYMESINYDGLPLQKELHEAFIDRVVNIDLGESDEMDDNQNEYLRELLEFLNDWLINHILRIDKLIPAK